ncbi:MAG: WD40-repeat-containing domain protein [Olpidium bornovanus]|uniref:WD40-repeat-containing domain protein n=1 Tax=Olpidium bornovanus TaxID=278681 RepID=A0A8H7ZY63_9FUNG|nr:MAG: WD40-repeat-containing domain protein [Olpidium bornovanus]
MLSSTPGFNNRPHYSDNTLRIWDTETAAPVDVLHGHTSRIWDVASDRSGSMVASASGDGTVKVRDILSVGFVVFLCCQIWNLKEKNSCGFTLACHDSDVYTVQYHPGEIHVVTGGYDKTVRLLDINTGQVIKSFTGHQLSVSKCIFNPLGNLIISGSKDSTIKFWDIVSGLCIRTITSHLGEVTSVEMSADGSKLLSSSKDNSNRLWDVRTTRPIRRLKGHQNTSRNFVRSGFAGKMVVGGSEDGIVYLWDQVTGEILQRLRGHRGIVYNAAWSAKQSLFVSCSDDRTVKTWWYDADMPLFSKGIPGRRGEACPERNAR